MSQARIAVGIINFNTRELLRACLASVPQAAASRIIVVDNASSDGSADMVRSEFPDVLLRENQGNIGYGAAANQAVASCTDEYILLLNSDTRLHAGALETISQTLHASPSTAIVGPGLVNTDGTLQRSCFPYPTPGDIFLDVSGIGGLIRFVPGLKERYLRTWKHDRVRSVPWVLGAALGIRRDAFNAVGGFDEAFYMYYEEVDLCYRLRKSGWEVLFTPSASLTHTGSASTVQRRAEMILQLYASLEMFYQKHYTRARQVEFHLLILGVAWARLVRDRMLLRLAGDEQRKARLIENTQVWTLLSQRCRRGLAHHFSTHHLYDPT